MKQGEIWKVNFDPSVGHEIRKIRPAVIIAAGKVIKFVNLVTVMPITSNMDNYLDDDIKILKDENNRLFTDSIIKIHCINSFHKGPERFVKKVGVVNEYILEQIQKCLKRHFGME